MCAGLLAFRRIGLGEEECGAIFRAMRESDIASFHSTIAHCHALSALVDESRKRKEGICETDIGWRE